MDDPYLWLEDVHGEKALSWVRERNARTMAVLKADPRYQKDYDAILAILDASDRIPGGVLFRRDVFNFWQDAEHPKGLWRRTTIASYETPNPEWDVLLDIDKLAAEEKENWVFAGSERTPTFKHALISLSRGGTDAHVVREFDPATRTFRKDGFSLPEAKSGTAYYDDDTVLFATDFGEGSMTTSGYPRIVKLWTRGKPVAEAKTVFEGAVDDVIVSPFVGRDTDGTPYGFVSRARDFFHTEYAYIAKDGTATTLPLPQGAVLHGIHDGFLLLTLREAWTYQPAQGGELTVPQGALAAFPFKRWLAGKAMPRADILYVPDTRATIEGVASGDRGVFVDVFENVLGSVYLFRRDADGTWSKTKLALPDGGSPSISSINEFGPEAQFGFQGYLDPPTVYADDGDGLLKAIKQLPQRFDARGMTVEQHEAISADGERIPYFLVRKPSSAPQPTILYGYGGFEVSQMPWYWARRARSGWKRAARSRSRTSAAAASSVRPGTGPRSRKTASAPSTILPPLPPIFRRAASPRRSSSASWAVRMAGCWSLP
jgi:prolyl oligopeptidase